MSFGPTSTSHQVALSALIRALGDRLSGNITQRGDCLVMMPAQERLCPRSAAVNSKAKLTAPKSTQRRAFSSQPNAKLSKPAASVRRSQAKAGVKSDCVEDMVITSAQQAADNSMPWPPRAPEWDAYDSCQQSLQYQIDDLLKTVEIRLDPNQAQDDLNRLIREFSRGPSGFISDYMLPAVPTTFRTSYIDAESQKLIDQINATIAAWKLAQPLWGTAFGRKYTRDALGRITRMQEVVLGQSDPDKTYQYDTAGRLTGVTVNGISTTWGYDANGNRTHENGQAIATYDSQDKLQSWRGTTYQYNAAGDLTQKRSAAGTSTYRYDSQGNLRQVTLEDGRRIDYAIDPDNRRVGKKINGQLQWQMVWQDSLRPIARLKADGSLEATYYYADSPNVPAAMSKGGKLYRIITDHLGSVRMVMDAETGEIAQRMNYDAWGQVVMDTNPGFQPFGFAGGIYDPDTKLTRFGARDYDAETGRWTAKDPILLNGGDSNFYNYVGTDPINFDDPEGLRRPTIRVPNNYYHQPQLPHMPTPAPGPQPLPSPPRPVLNLPHQTTFELIKESFGNLDPNTPSNLNWGEPLPFNKWGSSCRLICSGTSNNMCGANDGCVFYCGPVMK